MAAAWSFSRGGSQSPGSISRLVSTLSLDGDRISADLIVLFQRALSTATAESVADEIARAATEILGEQISQGDVPLSKEELVARVKVRITASAAKVAELEVKGLYVLGSDAVTNRSTYRFRQASPPPPRANASGAITAVRPSGSAQTPVLTPPPTPRMRTLWPRAIAHCRPGTPVEELGALLGPPLRDSLAAAILHAFVAIDPEAADRLVLFSASKVVREVLLEVCACFSSAAYRIFASNDIEQRVASELVRAASRLVLDGESLPTDAISRYMTSEAPVRDLATRLATAVGALDMAHVVQGALSPYCEAFRDDVTVVAGQLRRLLVTADK